jgi:hypothetical protein
VNEIYSDGDLQEAFPDFITSRDSVNDQFELEPAVRGNHDTVLEQPLNRMSQSFQISNSLQMQMETSADSGAHRMTTTRSATPTTK